MTLNLVAGGRVGILRRNKKGQSVAELGILLAIVSMALLGMQVYVKRGIQGKLKEAVICARRDGLAQGQYIQYEPYYLSSSITSTSDSNSVRTGTTAMSLPSMRRYGSKSNRHGTETTAPPSN